MINRHSVLLTIHNQLPNENNQLWLLVQKYKQPEFGKYYSGFFGDRFMRDCKQKLDIFLYRKTSTLLKNLGL